jgi:aspartate-semialdehyde dehydrogenase
MERRRVGILGATGMVGQRFIQLLSHHPWFEIAWLAASDRSAGKRYDEACKWKLDTPLPAKIAAMTLMPNVPEGTPKGELPRIIFAALDAGVAHELEPKFAAAGCAVISNSSAFRMTRDVPLVVPEVNADAAKAFSRKYIIANPNCSTAQLVVALKPLHDHAKIKRVVVATYQSVSGAGKDAMDELFQQTRAVFVSDPVEPKKFPKRIAFNLIPQIDDFMEDGSTKEEWKMVAETKKILDPKIKLTATCVRVPVFISHSEAVNVEFERPISADEARDILREAPGCLVIDRREPGGYITPHEAAGEDATYISRIREDPTIDNGLNFWCVSDNLRKGAALNAIQIAEVVVNRGWLKPKQQAA